MTVIAGDPVFGMDASAPELYRFTEPSGLGSMAPDADYLFLRHHRGGGSESDSGQKQQEHIYAFLEAVVHE
jgi:hypothetical protein